MAIELCRLVNSSRVKILYDIYHAQLMEADISHIHTGEFLEVTSSTTLRS
jgi:hydroxypyruvate isomerase